MTNWCINFLLVTGPEPHVARFQQQAASVAAAKGDTPKVFSFQSLVPLPRRGRTSPGEDPGFGSPEQEWGCPWDACQAELMKAWDEGVLYQFATLWHPPLPFLRQVSQRWPTLVFELEYEEPRPPIRGVVRATAGSMRDCDLEL